MIKEGTYKSPIQGVSQQIAQERLDGQLGEQINMLSDPASGLRRRTGTLLHGLIDVDPNSSFNIIQLVGEYYIQAVEPSGRLYITRFRDLQVMHDAIYPYLQHDSKSTIRYAISRNQVFVLNTEKVPMKVDVTETIIPPLTNEVNNTLAWVNWHKGLPPRGFYARTERMNIFRNGTLVAYAQHNIPVDKAVSPAERAKAFYTAAINDPVLSEQFEFTLINSTIAIVDRTGVGNITIGHYSNTGVNTADYGGIYYNTATRATLSSDLPLSFDQHYVEISGITYIFDAKRKFWVTEGVNLTNLDPKGAGWINVRSGAFSKTYTLNLTQGSIQLTYSVTTHASTAAEATPEYVAEKLEQAMVADTNFTTNFSVQRSGVNLAIVAISKTDQLILEVLGGDLYITSSGGSVIRNKDLLPATLPDLLDGYVQGVGVGKNLAYFKFDKSTRTWTECGTYENRYVIRNTPIIWYYDTTDDRMVVEPLDINGRVAGNDDNNPEPAFMDFGITGIGAYQSRLILLSGAYICMSRSNDPATFMRTTVEEVLDDDPIEISATALSNSQFEYAIPYNKDLILFSQTQQAVIPASNVVLTPKTAVIYPTTQQEISLSVAPVVAARSLYYAYQRGVEYYQVGELIPNQYTDAQYNPQNLTDHLPLYAKGICTSMAGSSTNNSVMFSSDTNEVLINQFIWAGDERAIMGFHKWVLPRKVRFVMYLQEYSVLLVEEGEGIAILTTNTQLNQLGTKPIPFLDMYQRVQLDENGKGLLLYKPDGDLVAIIYDDVNQRHMEIAFKYSEEDSTITCDYVGEIVVGLRYKSLFALTPPYLKDENGNVQAGIQTRVHSFRLTFRGTGEFKYNVTDFAGTVYDYSTSGANWCEVNLGFTWVNSVSTTVIPIRSRLDGLTCAIYTDSTTDLNLTTAEYVLRIAQKHGIGRRR